MNRMDSRRCGNDGSMMASNCRIKPSEKVSALALMLLLSTVGVGAGWAQKRVLHVEPGVDGDIALEARGVTVGETLRALGAETGFRVVIDDGIQRPLVDVEVAPSPLENVLRQVLLGRNYAVYSASADSDPSLVIVLPPSARRSAVAAGSRRTSRARRR